MKAFIQQAQWLFFILFFSLLTQVSLAEPSLDDLQAVMIYKVIDLTAWPQSETDKQIKIGVYGASSAYINNLNQTYNQRRINNKPLKAFAFNPFQPMEKQPAIHVLIIKKQYAQQLKEISKRSKENNILLITEESNDHKHLMVNLSITHDGTLGFAINRANILLANLKISKDIVLAGGTEMDVAKIFDQAVSDLVATQKQLTEKESQLKQQKLKIQQLARAIKQQQEKVQQQDKKILLKDSELAGKEAQLQQLETDLDLQIKIIETSTSALENIEGQLKSNSLSLEQQEIKNLSLSDKIKNNLKILEQQKQELKNKEAEITSKTNLLSLADEKASQQESTIQTQKHFLIASTTIGVLSISLILLLYRFYLAKKKSTSLLESKNQQLEKTMKNLHLTQEQLVESEKMASLGGMVAGIAHEVNTPAGIVLTADTSLLEATRDLKNLLDNNQMKEQDLLEYLDFSNQCTQISVDNIKRVANLITTFKKVAVDQSNNEYCQFNLNQYLKEINTSLQHLVRNSEHKIKIEISEPIELTSYPAVYMQIIHTLVSNSLMHGFKEIKHGVIKLSFRIQEDLLLFTYKDNGCGADKEVIEKIFDPFYTTSRGSGSTGLGTHILYNMVTQLLRGRVKCSSNYPHGLIFDFELPLKIFAKTGFNDQGIHLQ